MTEHYKPVSGESPASINQRNRERWGGGEATFTDNTNMLSSTKDNKVVDTDRIEEGMQVQVKKGMQGAGKKGEVTYASPSSGFVTVRFKNGSSGSYHESDLIRVFGGDSLVTGADALYSERPVEAVRPGMYVKHPKGTFQVGTVSNKNGIFILKSTSGGELRLAEGSPISTYASSSETHAAKGKDSYKNPTTEEEKKNPQLHKFLKGPDNRCVHCGQTLGKHFDNGTVSSSVMRDAVAEVSCRRCGAGVPVNEARKTEGYCPECASKLGIRAK